MSIINTLPQELTGLSDKVFDIRKQHKKNTHKNGYAQLVGQCNNIEDELDAFEIRNLSETMQKRARDYRKWLLSDLNETRELCKQSYEKCKYVTHKKDTI